MTREEEIARALLLVAAQRTAWSDRSCATPPASALLRTPAAEMTVPPLPERGNMLERALPKVYDPLQQTQQAIGGAAFGMTGMGALADLAEAAHAGRGDVCGCRGDAGRQDRWQGRQGRGEAGRPGGHRARCGGVCAGELFADPKLKAKAEALRGTYPQYAEQYPRIGPPALKANLPDPNKPGKFLAKPAKGELPYANMEEALARSAEPGFFLEKKLTPEAEQFQSDRNLIQQDMDLHGYKPYFDPKKRTDVDPKHYGPFEDTAVTAAPKTAKTQAEWAEKYGTPEIRARAARGFRGGQEGAGERSLVLHGPAREGIRQGAGREEGPRRVQKRVRRHDGGDHRRRCAV